MKRKPAWTPFVETGVNGPAVDAYRQPNTTFWLNSRYFVERSLLDGTLDGWVWLSFHDLDRTADLAHDWRDMQRIKNELVGPEREGFELFPRESRLVDTTNQFHIWVMPKGATLPIGYADRCVMHNAVLKRTRQRPFELDAIPPDAAEHEAVARRGYDTPTVGVFRPVREPEPKPVSWEPGVEPFPES